MTKVKKKDHKPDKMDQINDMNDEYPCLECGNYLSKLCDGKNWRGCLDFERI